MMDREIRLLEFNKIRQALAGKTITVMGRELAEDLAPTNELQRARKWQSETTEASSLLTRHAIGLEAVPDLRRILGVAARGGSLAEEHLLGILILLNSVTRLKTFFKEREGFPLLTGLTGQMAALPPLRERLRQIVDDDGNMRDDASPEMAQLRRAITSGERDLRERFDRFVRNPVNHKILQENLVTVRSGRLVVPVRQESRSQIPGVVHDQSASGATLYIEPLWAVETNNRLAALHSEKEKERERILSGVSQWIGGENEILYDTLTLYAELDFILAKGRLSLAGKCTEPRLNDEGYLHIISGYHPLLCGDVVPIDLELGRDIRTLVITGPNTGGKTVTIKTVGLFSLMAQSGLHVPAAAGSQLCVFPRIFADIGDEQDIEQSLSTFSGHLKNITEIIAGLVPGALVLLDEVGAGTDPTEGAGLAMSILEYLHHHRAVTVATTHYSELKAFAYVTEGMENASVEFDVATLRPTYQLLVGVPGKSNAFAIAARLGLPEEIIERSKNFLSYEEMRLEEVVADLVANRQQMERASLQAEHERQETHFILTKVRKEQEELQQRRDEVLNKARMDALEMLTRAKRESQQFIKQLRKLAAQNCPPGEVQIREVTQNLEQMRDELQAQLVPHGQTARLSPEDITPGVQVFINSLGQPGVISRVSEQAVQVQVGAMYIQVDAADLSPLKQSQKKEKPAVTGLALFAKRDVSNELDLRGLVLDEAIVKVEGYLDDAVLADLKEVRLIHGKGTGRLRSGLREYLHNHRYIVAMRTGYPAEGGTGVTVVQLK